MQREASLITEMTSRRIKDGTQAKNKERSGVERQGDRMFGVCVE